MVSILARPEGRALPGEAGCYTPERFNPRPPRGTGATPPMANGRACFNPRPPRGTGATVRLQRHDFQR